MHPAGARGLSLLVVLLLALPVAPLAQSLPVPGSPDALGAACGAARVPDVPQWFYQPPKQAVLDAECAQASTAAGFLQGVPPALLGALGVVNQPDGIEIPIDNLTALVALLGDVGVRSIAHQAEAANKAIDDVPPNALANRSNVCCTNDPAIALDYSDVEDCFVSLSAAPCVHGENALPRVIRALVVAVRPDGLADVREDATIDGDFTFTLPADAPEGAYGFYTLLTDQAGNQERAPTAAQSHIFVQQMPVDSLVVFDRGGIASSASLDVPFARGAVDVAVTVTDPASAVDANFSGLRRVDLYQRDATHGFQVAWSSPEDACTAPGPALAHLTAHVTLAAEGVQEFFTRASDCAGNEEAAKVAAEAQAVNDVTPPQSLLAPLPAYTLGDALPLSLASCADPPASTDGTSSGVASWVLGVQGPGDAGLAPDAAQTQLACGSIAARPLPADGVYRYASRAEDVAGNVEGAHPAPDTAVLRDTLPPSASIGTPAFANAPWVAHAACEDPRVDADHTPSGLARCAVAVTGPESRAAEASLPACPGPQVAQPSQESLDLPLLPVLDGAYSVHVEARDCAGHVTTADGSTFLDRVAPSVGGLAQVVTRQTEAALPLDIVDPAPSSGLASATCVAGFRGAQETRLDLPVTLGAQQGPGSCLLPLPGEDGVREVTVEATDRAGNAARRATRVELDRAPPTIGLAVPDAFSPAVAPGVADIHFDLADAGVLVRDARLTVTVDGPAGAVRTLFPSGPEAYGALDLAWDGTTDLGAPAVDGVYFLHATAVDAALNAQELTRSFLLDTTPPSASASASGAAGLAGWFTGPVDVTFHCADALTACHVARTVGAGAEQPGADGGIVRIAAQGTTQVAFAGVDAVGNRGATQSLAVRVDSQAPTTFATASGIAGEAGFYLGAVTLTFACDDATSGCAGVQAALDDGPFVAMLPDAHLIVSGEGGHTVRFAARDVAGNAEPERALSFTIDTLPPTATATLTGALGDAGWFTGPVQVALACEDARACTLGFRFGDEDWQTYSAPFTLGAGEHAMKFRARDAAGNVELEQPLTVRVDDQLPVTGISLTGRAGADGWFTGPVLAALTCSDAPSGCASITATLDDAPAGALATITDDGAHHLTAQSRDVAGNLEALQARTVRI
ncbi:MAG: hypothetical protein LC624_04775, partial [Halobacteriales archaeon]|nr:hypothetical protein [Halobacteriales archaeon]